MTENEAIGYFRMATDEVGNEEFSDVYKDMCKLAIQALEEIQQYRAIGTVEEFKALKEKNEPKKTLYNGANWYKCPNGCEVHKKAFEKDWYCPKCGQRLDWQ